MLSQWRKGPDEISKFGVGLQSFFPLPNRTIRVFRGGKEQALKVFGIPGVMAIPGDTTASANRM
jgi:hypothetical protein